MRRLPTDYKIHCCLKRYHAGIIALAEHLKFTRSFQIFGPPGGDDGRPDTGDLVGADVKDPASSGPIIHLWELPE